MADIITDPQSQATIQVASIVYAENQPLAEDSNDRIRQQQVIPTAIKGRLMQPVQDTDGQFFTTGSLVPNGRSLSTTITTTSKNGGMILVQPAYSIFIDDTNPLVGLVPYVQSSLSFPFYTWNPTHELIFDKSTGAFQGFGQPLSRVPGKSISAINVRNASGSDHVIYISYYLRMIINGSGQNSA